MARKGINISLIKSREKILDENVTANMKINRKKNMITKITLNCLTKERSFL